MTFNPVYQHHSMCIGTMEMEAKLIKTLGLLQLGTVSVQKPNQNEMQKGDDGFTSVDVSQANLP